MFINLTQFEQKLVEQLTKNRTEENKKQGRIDMKMTSKDGIQIQLDGYGAELATCKHLGVWFDLTTQITNPDYDLIYNGKKIDIKNIDKKFSGIMTYKNKDK